MRFANPITLTVLASLALMAALPAASAQVAPLEQRLAITLHAKPLEAPIEPGTTATIPLLVEVDYFTAMALLNPQGFDVDLHITALPSWASAMIQPSTLRFVPSYAPHGHMTRQVATAELLVMVREDAAAEPHDIAEVTATFAGATGMRASEATVQTPIAAGGDAPVEECHHEEASPGQATSGGSAGASDEASPVTTQSLGATGTSGAALGFALAGGLAGVAAGALAMAAMKRRRS